MVLINMDSGFIDFIYMCIYKVYIKTYINTDILMHPLYIV